MENYSAVLKNVIEQCRKKSNPSQNDRANFHDNWVNLAKLEGFTELSEKYLYDGVSYFGAAAFKDYLSQSDDASGELDKFFSGHLYSANKGGAFRIVVNLLALYLNDGGSLKIVSRLIEELPSVSKNKDGKIWGKANKMLAKHFFDALKAEAKLTPVSELNLSASSLDFLKQLLSESAAYAESAGISSARIAAVKNWISDYRPPAKTFKLAARLSRTFDDTIKFIEGIEAENERLNGEISKLNLLLNTERKQLETTQQSLAALNGKIRELQTELGAKDEAIGRKETEIADNLTLIEFLKKEQNYNAEVALDKIACDLKIEHRDFQSAVEVPMSVELGENFRQQLKNIFKVLERHGLKFE